MPYMQLSYSSKFRVIVSVPVVVNHVADSWNTTNTEFFRRAFSCGFSSRYKVISAIAPYKVSDGMQHIRTAYLFLKKVVDWERCNIWKIQASVDVSSDGPSRRQVSNWSLLTSPTKNLRSKWRSSVCILQMLQLSQSTQRSCSHHYTYNQWQKAFGQW